MTERFSGKLLHNSRKRVHNPKIVLPLKAVLFYEFRERDSCAGAVSRPLQHCSELARHRVYMHDKVLKMAGAETRFPACTPGGLQMQRTVPE